MTALLAQGLRADRSFERLYRRHAADVYRYALAVLRNPADAEDVTQTTFLNAYRAFQKGERPRQPQNWLIAIAHNVCRQRFRQATRRPQEVAFDDNATDWLEQDERGPTADDLRRALGHLAFNQRAALVMRELEGRSYAEIAELLAITVPAVETLIFRARRAVREQLEGSLTCDQAERALSLEVDGRLSRADKGPLRAHLRECKPCAKIARSQRAQRSAFKALAALPLPSSLSSLLGGGGSALATKAAAVAVGAAIVGSVGLTGEQSLVPHAAKATRATHAAKATSEQIPPEARHLVHSAAPARTRPVPVVRVARLAHHRQTKPDHPVRHVARPLGASHGGHVATKAHERAAKQQSTPAAKQHGPRRHIPVRPGANAARPARAGAKTTRPASPGQAKKQAPTPSPEPVVVAPAPAPVETAHVSPGQLKHAG